MIKEMFTTLLNIKHNGITWTIRGQYLTPIMNEFVETQNIASLLDHVTVGDGVRIIKSNKARTTLSAPFANGQRVIVKKYHSKGWFERIKYLFRPSRAKAEWDTMNALLDKGISTCVPLAYGERRRWGFLLDESLIIEEIPDSLTFQAYIKRLCSGTLTKDKILRKRALLEKLAKFIHCIHEKNIDHRDFHGDNILVTKINTGNPVLHLVDLHKARVCTRLSLRRRINDLARIIDIDTPKNPLFKTDCLRLIKHYNNYCPPTPSFPLKGGGEGGGAARLPRDKKDFKRFASKVLKRAKIHRNKRIKSSTRWCLKLSDFFAVYKAKDMRIYYRKEYKLADILDLLKRVGNYSEGLHRRNIITTTPQSPPSQGGSRSRQSITTPLSPPSQGGDKGEVKQILKRSSKSVVLLEEIPFKGIPKKVVIKYNFYRGFFDTLKKTFLGTRSRKAWIAANGIILRGIATPQPIALIEKKFHGFTCENYLLTEYIDDSLRANEYFTKYFNNKPDSPESPLPNREMGIKRKNRFIEDLARFVRSFHETGFYHCDLCGVNILVKEVQRENWEIFLIDLDSVSLKKRLTLRRRLENFSQINSSFSSISNVDKMRFFKAYFSGLPPKAHKYIEAINKLIEARRIRKLRQHKRKSRRRLQATRWV